MKRVFAGLLVLTATTALALTASSQPPDNEKTGRQERSTAH